ncbi:MAG TPA: DNA glycosylase [Lachnospiraceae bacterium]|nr:DNA glycosylase [Lachnospiraceae bacterium]
MQVSINDDFDLKKVALSGQCFRVREFENGMFRFISTDKILYIRKTESHFYEVSCDSYTWKTFWTNYFDLDRCYSNIRSSIPTSDPYMITSASEGNGIRILRQDPWEMLITFIISQRKTIPAIKQSVELLASKYGTPITTEYETIHSFPDCDALAFATDADLNECKLGYRTSYVKDAISLVYSNKINLSDLCSLSDFSLFEMLKIIKGVGDKVSNCVCLFAYGRTALAPIDVWIKRTIDNQYNGISPFPQYGENAGIMQQYIFYYNQIHKKM